MIPLVLLFAIFSFLPIDAHNLENLSETQKIVVATKKIDFPDFPSAYNPSIIKTDAGIFLSFRYQPDFYYDTWVSYIGIVRLNEELEPVGRPQILNTRLYNRIIESHSEDARLFTYKGRIFLIYNDNMDVSFFSWADRRDMHIAELFFDGNQFSLSAPLKLSYLEKSYVLWEKNWVPFEWNQKLLLAYTVNPHEILLPNLQNGACYFFAKSEAFLDWELGSLRGSTPPQLMGEEFLAFFHSATSLTCGASMGEEKLHYFMGAYTFSSAPPFELTSYTPLPIVGEGFYTSSLSYKKVIFPGGFIVSDSSIYLAYGKDDCEIWIAKMDLLELKKHLKNIQRN